MSQLSEQDRVELAQTVLSLFHAWHIEPEQQVILLGFPANTHSRFLKRYQEGTPFPDEQDLLNRAAQFLQIDSALLTTFPHNPNMGRVWLKNPNRRFGKQSPLALMLSEGLNGIYQVKSHLDCTHNWI